MYITVVVPLWSIDTRTRRSTVYFRFLLRVNVLSVLSPPLFLGECGVVAAVVDVAAAAAAAAAADLHCVALLLTRYWAPRGTHTCILVHTIIVISCVALFGC